MKKRLLSLIMVLCIMFSVAGCVDVESGNKSWGQNESITEININQLPEFSGKPYVVVNDNMPGFSQEDLTDESFYYLSNLDRLGRCGACYGVFGPETIARGDRGSIGMVKPSGWQTARYDCVEGNYLYNRSHLLMWKMSGILDDERNLITGTRFMNVDGMLPFEEMVVDYIYETDNHVMYRVTPIFVKNELVARGVQMEAMSVEDNGADICFNIYVYNNQPGVVIDYATGKSWRDRGQSQDKDKNQQDSSNVSKSTYVLNVNSKKYHTEDCNGVKSMNKENRKTYRGSAADLEKQGYEPCGNCIE